MHDDAEAGRQSLIEGLPQLFWRADGAGRWTWSSPQWRSQTGQDEREGAGDGWIEAVHPDDREATRAAWRDALASGVLHVEHRLRDVRSDGWRWFQTRAALTRDDGGGAAEWIGACTDIHALRLLQDRQRALVLELQHRTRNLMSVVRAVGAASAEAGASVAEYQRRFNRRLGALGRAQTVLSSRGEGEPVTLGALLRSERDAVMEAGALPRVTLDGPEDVAIRSPRVQIVTLALHELFVNAVEHGALSQPAGALDVRWGRSTHDPARVRLDWRETGVALPRPLGPSGFGREIIEQALPFQAGADVDYAFGPDGLACVIEIGLRPA